MHVYIFVCMYVCLSACLPVCLSVYMSLCLHFCMSVCICMYTMYVYLWVYLCFHLSISDDLCISFVYSFFASEWEKHVYVYANIFCVSVCIRKVSGVWNGHCEWSEAPPQLAAEHPNCLRSWEHPPGVMSGSDVRIIPLSPGRYTIMGLFWDYNGILDVRCDAYP